MISKALQGKTHDSYQQCDDQEIVKSFQRIFKESLVNDPQVSMLLAHGYSKNSMNFKSAVTHYYSLYEFSRNNQQSKALLSLLLSISYMSSLQNRNMEEMRQTNIKVAMSFFREYRSTGMNQLEQQYNLGRLLCLIRDLPNAIDIFKKVIEKAKIEKN